VRDGAIRPHRGSPKDACFWLPDPLRFCRQYDGAGWNHCPRLRSRDWGLFLAFPAILPASLTLVASQDGRQSAVEEARGAILGAVGLGGFAASVWLLADKVAPGLALTVAAAVWFVISCTLWWMSNGRRAN
jgi:hypothetical protein